MVWFSQLEFHALSTPFVTKLMFPTVPVPDPCHYECAIVFGGSNPKRIQPAVELALASRVEAIIVTGAQVRDPKIAVDVSEAEHLARYAIERGVSPAIILREPHATNTKENALYSLSVLARARNLGEVRNIAVVSHPAHVKRAILSAKTYFPETIAFTPYPAPYVEVNRTNWWKTEKGVRFVTSEFHKIVRYIQVGDLNDEDVLMD